MKLSTRIKNLRIKNGLTQLELSEKSAVSLRTIQRIENDEVSPSMYSLKKIGEVLKEDLNSKNTVLTTNRRLRPLIVIAVLSILILSIGVYNFRANKTSATKTVDYWSQVYAEAPTSDGGIIKYYDTNCYGSDGSDCDIIILKYLNDNLQWKTTIGGTSWDYVKDLLEVEDGYFILGHTGSYGVGNNDVFLTKLDKNGTELWFRTYGAQYNDYGLNISASKTNKNEYVIEGLEQFCPTQNNFNDCYMKELVIIINEAGDIRSDAL